jgi:hypothetical protein
LRYVVEGAGESMESWFSLFDDKRTRYVVNELGLLEAATGLDVLTPSDGPLFEGFRKAVDRAVRDPGHPLFPGNGNPSAIVHGTAAEAELCPSLREHSLAELAPLASSARR